MRQLAHTFLYRDFFLLNLMFKSVYCVWGAEDDVNDYIDQFLPRGQTKAVLVDRMLYIFVVAFDNNTLYLTENLFCS